VDGRRSVVFDVHVNDWHSRTREGFPELDRTRAQVLARIADPPEWADSLYVFERRTGRHVVIAWLSHKATAAEGRRVFDLRVFPQEWQEEMQAALVAAGERQRAEVVSQCPQGSSGE
jgi:hypothetical protein